MRLTALLIPVTCLPVLIASAASAADVTVLGTPGNVQSPPDAGYTAPPGELANARVHIEALGCRIFSDASAMVDLGASPATASHAIAASCAVVVQPINCRIKERVDFTVEAEHRFFFDPSFAGQAPDGAIHVAASASTFGIDTHVSFDSSTDYAAVQQVAPPSKKGYLSPVPPPLFIPGVTIDTIELASSATGPGTLMPGSASFTFASRADSWVEVTQINAADAREVRATTATDGSLYCGQSKTYYAFTTMSVDLSLAAYDDLLANLATTAVTDVAFDAWVR